MASSFLEVGSEGLKALKDDLTNLSKSLHQVYELMNADLSKLGEAWRDSKYEEFLNGFRPQMNKCEEIAQRYEDWCKKVLDPAIKKCIKIEDTDVSGNNAGPSMGSDVNSTSSSTTTTPSKADRFREGTPRVQARINVLRGQGIDPNERLYPPQGIILQEEAEDKRKEIEVKTREMLLAQLYRGRGR